MAASGGGQKPGAVLLPPGLDQLVRSYPASVDKALGALKLGVGDFHKENYSAALRDLPDEGDAAATAVPDYALLYRAKASLALENGEESLRLFRLVRSRYPNSPVVQQAILGECQALLTLHQPAAVLVFLQEQKVEESADIVYARAQALEQAGKNNDAATLYLRIFAKYTTSPTASIAEQRLKALSPGFQSRAMNYASMLERADNLVRAGRTRDARALLLRLASVAAPDNSLGARRRVLLAQVEYNLGKGSTLLPLLEKLSAAESPSRAQALYLLGLCYRRANREEAFFATRDRLLSLYPQSHYAERLLYSSAGYLDLENRTEEAGRTFGMVSERFPKGEYAERALWRSCLFQYFDKHYEEALKGFWRYHTSHPDTRFSVPTLYWMGRCYEKLGDGSRAAYLFERCRAFAGENYYGQRASESEQALKRSGALPGRPTGAIDFGQVRQWAEGLRRPDTAIREPAKEVEAVLERARQLTTAELPDLALSELRSGMRRFPEDRAMPFMISRICDRKGDVYGVIRALHGIFPDYDARPVAALPQEAWEMLYPTRHESIISAQAAKYKLDPNLVRAIIRQESAFVEDARSPANARGLMQVLPSTGRRLARGAGVSRYTVQKLYRPEVNIALGTRFLAGLLDEYDHKLEIALAAYNAGTDRADRWIRDYDVSDMAEFVDRIPFAETRDYVKQVFTNTAYYRLISTTLNAESR